MNKKQKKRDIFILVCTAGALFLMAYNQPVEESCFQKRKEKEDAEYNAEAKKLFDAFMSMEGAGLNYLYAYYDYDEDGQIELCLMHKEKTKGNVFEYKNGGLQYKSVSDTTKIFSPEWEWMDAPEALPDTEEMTHLGMYVYISENKYGEDSFWYLDEESFLKANGFEGKNSFYEYFDADGNVQMALYYDEQTKHGSGIRYYERDPSTFETTGYYGFTFTEPEQGIWEETQDYFALTTYDGCSGEKADGYQEEYEYDEDGKILHYTSTGLYEWSDGEVERRLLLDIEFVYNENGNLKERYYQHASWWFGTGYTLWACYFDELERIEYEYIYITHGHIENYYIYSDESDKPDYMLMLDCNMGNWLPEFTQYQ